MEINITSLLETDLFAFSHSRMEGGQDAGRNTWNAAKAEAGSTPLLQTPEQLDAMRGWAKRSGGWNKEEIDAWDDCELNALFLQLIAGDVREAGWDCLDSEVWMEDGDLMDSLTEERSENCLIFKTESGEIFYYLGE